jgi:hypothetical protein
MERDRGNRKGPEKDYSIGYFNRLLFPAVKETAEFRISWAG